MGHFKRRRIRPVSSSDGYNTIGDAYYMNSDWKSEKTLKNKRYGCLKAVTIHGKPEPLKRQYRVGHIILQLQQQWVLAASTSDLVS